ncbi:ABC transporter permease [Variovorax saccharolyticus]|uniref:ABC transporter permease n=1 Tax=Variovorax saccharolyticus TaxID=3053516 RepID=UPI002574AE17|nr:ABC transporter permease [Variovorax sp. J31P216]MDM0029619.1 ABC transporter permease [Variovorax sp. J31P216]
MIQDYWRRSARSRESLLLIVGLLIVWEAAVRLLGVREFVFPPPSTIFADMASAPVYFLRESLFTMVVTLSGFALALMLGVVFAVLIVYSPILDRTLYTLLVALNAVPKVALAPLFVIWLGTESKPKIAIATLIAIFPILVDTVHGLRAIDPEMINMAKAGHASAAKTLWKVRFPNALPSMLAGMKVGISLALVGAIVGEFVAGDSGLGHVILVAQSSFDTPRLFAALVLLGVLGTLLFKMVDWIETLVIPWHVSHRGKRSAAKPLKLPRQGASAAVA